MKCEEYHSNDFITNWCFGCSNHKGYQKMDAFDAVDALYAIGGMPNVNAGVIAKMKKELKRAIFNSKIAVKIPSSYSNFGVSLSNKGKSEIFN